MSQPTALYGFQLPSSWSAVKPAASSVSSGMSAGCLQEHSRRPRRCAVMRMTEEATLNGATPMFKRRVSVPGASLVCSVESTK